jgi:hypothetical protein
VVALEQCWIVAEVAPELMAMTQIIQFNDNDDQAPVEKRGE